MVTLGIETSCDETSVSLTDGKTVLANIVSSSVHLHKRYGGVVPEIASRYHVEYVLEVLDKALAGSGKSLRDVRLIAVTHGPGLVGALLIGLSLAKSLALCLRVPIVGTNHIHAHLYSAFLNSPGERPRFPFVGLVVSGGHTALFYCEGVDRQRLLGQTQDDAVGEAFDKVAKILKLGYPGGPIIEKMASRRATAWGMAGAGAGKAPIRFPRSYLGKGSLDFSFSGVKTAVLYHVNKTPQMDEAAVCDICHAFQEAALDVLVEKAFLAADLHGADRIVVGGGVAANGKLRDKFHAAAAGTKKRVYFPPRAYCMDNAAMIGSLGEDLFKKGHRSDLYLGAEPNLEVVTC